MKLDAKALDEAGTEARKTIAAADDPKALFIHDVDRALLRGAIHDGRGPVLTLALVDGIREARALTENLEIRLMETERARLVAEAQVASTQRLLDATRAACDRVQARPAPVPTENVTTAAMEAELTVLHGEIADLRFALNAADARYVAEWRRSTSGPLCAHGCATPTHDEAARAQGWSGTYDDTGVKTFDAAIVVAAKAHIRDCPNHPMRALEHERDELRADVRRLRGLLDAEAVNVSQLSHRAQAAESRANEAEALTLSHEGRIARMEAEAAATMERARSMLGTLE